MPELRIDPLSGLRVIVAGDRGGGRGPLSGRRRPRRPRGTIRSSRATRTGRRRRSTRCGRTAARPTRRAGACGWCRTFPGLALPERGRPGGSRWPRAAASPSSSPPARRRARTRSSSTARPVARCATSAPSRWRWRWACGRADAGPLRASRYVHLIVNEGQDAGASFRTRTPSSMRCRSCPPPWLASASASRPIRAARTDETCSPTWSRRRSAGASAWWRSTRRASRSAPSPPCPLPPPDRAPAPGRAVRGRRPALRGLLHDVLSRLAAELGGVPPFNLWVRTAPPGAETSAGGSTCCPAWPSCGPGDGHGVKLNVLAPELAAEHLRTRDARPALASARRPPSAARSPLFAAEPPQEPLPYGRWERRWPTTSSRPPAARVRRGLGEPGEISWFPDRTWGGRTYVPATAPTARARALRLRLLHPRARGRAGRDFDAVVDYTDETADANPDWKLDLSDQEIGHWRGSEGRRGVVTLVWGVPWWPTARWPPPSSAPPPPTSARSPTTASRSSPSTPTRATTWRCASTADGRGAGDGVPVRGRVEPRSGLPSAALGPEPR